MLGTLESDHATLRCSIFCSSFWQSSCFLTFLECDLLPSCSVLATVCSLKIMMPSGDTDCLPMFTSVFFGPEPRLPCAFSCLWMVTCLCFSVCPWGNSLLRASAQQAERESSAAVGRTSCQQELYAQSVTAVCSVSSAKQFNQGNTWRGMCCVWVWYWCLNPGVVVGGTGC